MQHHVIHAKSFNISTAVIVVGLRPHTLLKRIVSFWYQFSMMVIHTLFFLYIPDKISIHPCINNPLINLE